MATALDAVQNNRGLAVPFTLRDLERLPRELVVAELKARYANPEPQHKLGLAYAMARFGQVDAPFLASRIHGFAPEEFTNLLDALGRAREASSEAIHELAKKAAAEKNWRLKARLAVVALYLEDDRIAADMCRIDERPDPVQRTIFIDELPAWHGDVTELATYCQARSDAALKSGLCLAVGSIPLGQLTDAERNAWKPVLTQWYETASDGGTLSAAGWALRQSGIKAPAPSATSQASEGRQWLFVNSLGMTLLKINAGMFVRKDQTPEAKEQTVQLTRAFFLSDREISVGQFQQFTSDANYPNQEKPAKWPSAQPQASPAPVHPVQMVNWYDSVLFCNWLSRKEGPRRAMSEPGRKRNLNRMWNTTPGGWSRMRPATACRRRRSGSTPVVPGRRPIFPAATMKRRCGNTQWSKPIARLPVGASCQTAGGCSTCTGMCGSGAGMDMADTTRSRQPSIRRAPRSFPTGWFGAGAGASPPSTRCRRTGAVAHRWAASSAWAFAWPEASRESGEA